jgi:hypothetical protein
MLSLLNDFGLFGHDDERGYYSPELLSVIDEEREEEERKDKRSETYRKNVSSRWERRKENIAADGYETGTKQPISIEAAPTERIQNGHLVYTKQPISIGADTKHTISINSMPVSFQAHPQPHNTKHTISINSIEAPSETDFVSPTPMNVLHCSSNYSSNISKEKTHYRELKRKPQNGCFEDAEEETALLKSPAVCFSTPTPTPPPAAGTVSRAVTPAAGLAAGEGTPKAEGESTGPMGAAVSIQAGELEADRPAGTKEKKRTKANGRDYSVPLEERKQQFRRELGELWKADKRGLSAEEAAKFYNHWVELNTAQTKMRWEMEKTWETSRRMYKWAKNNFGTGPARVSSPEPRELPSAHNIEVS